MFILGWLPPPSVMVSAVEPSRLCPTTRLRNYAEIPRQARDDSRDWPIFIRAISVIHGGLNPFGCGHAALCPFVSIWGGLFPILFLGAPFVVFLFRYFFMSSDSSLGSPAARLRGLLEGFNKKAEEGQSSEAKSSAKNKGPREEFAEVERL